MLLKSNLLATHGVAGHVIVPGLNEIPDATFEKMKEYKIFNFMMSEGKFQVVHQKAAEPVKEEATQIEEVKKEKLETEEVKTSKESKKEKK